MMKSWIKYLAAIVGFLGACGMMTSCDKVDDILDTHDPNDVKSVNVEYSMDLSQTWFDFYDITVTYYDDKGKEHSLPVTEKWDYSFSVKPDKAPKNYVFTVVATPKKEHPEIDKPQYILSENISAKFYGIRYDGSIYKNLASDLNASDITWTDIYTLSTSQMKDFLKAGGRNISNFTHSFDGRY